MKTWAEKEVELACKREREAEGTPENEWSYGAACYESALKAFNSLLEDGHSGFSISMTKHILVRLIDGKPLTPIEDTEDIWHRGFNKEGGIEVYQNTRMYSLFKYIHPDGRITYSDNNRVVCHDYRDPDNTFTNKFISNIIDEMFPIEMPYYPGKPYNVCVEECLTDEKNGDYDTIRVYGVTLPNGKKPEIDRCFKETEDGFKEITHIEYLDRLQADEKRRAEKEKKEND